eukprot:2946029-Prymnesium_polylepis.1
MAPAAAANERTARARVRLQGSSSVAAVGARARRANAHSAATRRWCAGSGGLGAAVRVRSWLRLGSWMGGRAHNPHLRASGASPV